MKFHFTSSEDAKSFMSYLMKKFGEFSLDYDRSGYIINVTSVSGIVTKSVLEQYAQENNGKVISSV
jgi:hypothetical protein